MFLAKGIRKFGWTLLSATMLLAAGNAPALAQTARIQIIHNSPDPALQWLSLYLNDTKVADSLLFRNAKPYIEVAAGVGIQAGFAPLNSTSSADVFKTITIDLEEGKDYVAVILGVFSPNYQPNPDGISIGLDLLVKETRPLAASLETSDYLFINATTDAPSLDFRPRNGDPIQTGVLYGSAVGYAPFDDYVYTLDVALTDAPDRILGFFDVDVGFLKDKAFTVLTSGFLNRFENGSKHEFKLMIVTADGLTQAIGSSDPTEDIAMMQVINNSPDLNFPNGFDIYFNGGRAINDLEFRDATPFFGIPGNATVTIEIKNAPGGLSIRTTTLTVDPGKNYLVMITGVVDTEQYASNPDGEPTDLAISINPNIRLFPSQLGVGEFVFAHGLPDAPAAELEMTGLSDPIGPLSFAEMTDYQAISDFNVLTEMVAVNEDLPTFLGHRVEIPFVLGRTFVLYAAGFVQPGKNRNGDEAQLMLALTDGAVVALRFREVAAEAAKVQLVHASADTALQTADLYIDFELVADDASFKSGTPFIDVPSGKTVTVSVAPSESEGVEDATASFGMQFDEGVAYAGIVNGVGTPGDFAPNPDAKSTALGLHVIENVLENGLDGTQFTVMSANEITDAPSATVTSEQSQVLAQGIGFGENGDYQVAPALYRFIDVRSTGTAGRIGASYIPFDGLVGRAGILIASGFADTTANNGGPGFSTFIVLDDGATVQSNRNIVKTEDDVPEIAQSLRLQGNYPNPFTDLTHLVVDLPEAGAVSVSILDPTGRVVQHLAPTMVPAGVGHTIQISAKDLPAGMYLYTIEVAAASGTRHLRGQMMLIR